MRWRGSHTTGALSRIRAKASRESSRTLSAYRSRATAGALTMDIKIIVDNYISN
jgi:hypothetical protein